MLYSIIYRAYAQSHRQSLNKAVGNGCLFLCASLLFPGAFEIKEGDLIVDKLNIINCGKYFTIINLNGNYENHCHVNKYNTAELLCRLIQRKRVPNSSYLRESVKRVTLDKKYIRDINYKIMKDKNKQRYVNINKG